MKTEYAQAVLIIYLLLASFTDIIHKKLSLRFLAFGLFPIILGAVAAILAPESGIKDGLLQCAGGAAIGALFIPLSIVSKNRIGLADAVIFTICGAVFGYGGIVTVILFSFLLGGLYAAASLAIGRMTRKSSFAFVPFIMLGSAMAMII